MPRTPWLIAHTSLSFFFLLSLPRVQQELGLPPRLRLALLKRRPVESNSNWPSNRVAGQTTPAPHGHHTNRRNGLMRRIALSIQRLSLFKSWLACPQLLDAHCSLFWLQLRPTYSTAVPDSPRYRSRIYNIITQTMNSIVCVRDQSQTNPKPGDALPGPGSNSGTHRRVSSTRSIML